MSFNPVLCESAVLFSFFIKSREAPPCQIRQEGASLLQLYSRPSFSFSSFQISNAEKRIGML